MASRIISIRLQPIIFISSGSVFGYEILSHPILSNKQLNNPKRQSHDFYFLESTFLLEKVISQNLITRNQKLFVNFNRKELLEHNLIEKTIDMLMQYDFDPQNIVVEISEETSIQNLAVNNPINMWKEAGFQFALDDCGANDTIPLSLLNQLRFDIVKFDKSLLRVFDNQAQTINLLKQRVKIAKSKNIYTALEGIETESDLECAIESGVDFGQGFLLGMPKEVVKATI